MRNVTNWQVYATGTEPELRFGRGYTGHEHLNKFGLINMNARLYDPVLGRFLAPDPLVASPDESNGYNRYMYASNNPLMYVDIDGEQHIDNNGVWFNPNGKGNNTGSNFGGNPNTNLTGNDYTGGFNMGGGINYNGGYGSGYGGGFGGGYSYGASNNPLAFLFFLGDLFYTSKSERERFNVHVKSSPSAYTFKSTVRLKNVSGSGASTVYAGGGKRQGGLSSSQRLQLRDMVDAMEYRDFWQQRGAWVETQDRGDIIAGNLQLATTVLLFEIPNLTASINWVKGLFKGSEGSSAAKEVSLEGAVWAQKTFSETFSSGGKFAGQTVDDVVGALRNGTLSAADVPINVIVRNGKTFILNTRSSAALMQAGVPRSAWNIVNQTGVSTFESMLLGQLGRNGLINGTNIIKQSGTSFYLYIY